MGYTELLELFNETLDEQTASRLAEAITDAGGVEVVISILEK